MTDSDRDRYRENIANRQQEIREARARGVREIIHAELDELLAGSVPFSVRQSGADGTVEVFDEVGQLVARVRGNR